MELAKSYFNNEEYNLSKKTYLEVYRKYPDDLNCLGNLGTIYLDYLNKYNEAKNYFKRFIKLRPAHELASVSLFFCYLHLNDFDKAFSELKRYVDENFYSKEYKLILKDIRLKHIPDRHFNFVKEYRKILNNYYQNNIRKI